MFSQTYSSDADSEIFYVDSDRFHDAMRRAKKSPAYIETTKALRAANRALNSARTQYTRISSNSFPEDLRQLKHVLHTKEVLETQIHDAIDRYDYACTTLAERVSEILCILSVAELEHLDPQKEKKLRSELSVLRSEMYRAKNGYKERLIKMNDKLDGLNSMEAELEQRKKAYLMNQSEVIVSAMHKVDDLEAKKGLILKEQLQSIYREKEALISLISSDPNLSDKTVEAIIQRFPEYKRTNWFNGANRRLSPVTSAIIASEIAQDTNQSMAMLCARIARARKTNIVDAIIALNELRKRDALYYCVRYSDGSIDHIRWRPIPRRSA